MQQAIIPHIQTVSYPSEGMSMYRVALMWLKAKYDLKSQSAKTQQAYKETLESFDLYLQGRGLTLESNPREVAAAAQEWVVLSVRPGHAVSSSTVNQRYAILSSFYQYAVKFGACEHNPIEYCERPQRTIEDDAPALEPEYVADCMKRIDRRNREGMRDYTLLMLALVTGRRSGELTGLTWKDVTIRGTQMLLKFRCKGGKIKEDVLEQTHARLLLQFLRREYGQDLERIHDGSYIFQSHARNNPGGRLSATTVSAICLDRLGTSKVHVTRHTHAVQALEEGATLAEIGDQLGHANYKTTADYLKKKSKKVVSYGSRLAKSFGIEE